MLELDLDYVDLSRAAALQADPAVLFNRANISHALDRLEAACADLQEAVRLDPDEPDGWLQLCLVRAELTDHDGAALAAERFQALAPDQAGELPATLTAAGRPLADV